MRCLPVADDCGVSSPVTDIILRCIDAGSLRGTSVLAGGACAREAAHALGARLYRHPELAVGVHLNLLEGRCTAPPADIPLLADERGWFRHGLGSLWAAATLSRGAKQTALREQMLRECRAQIDWVQGAVRAGWLAARAAEHPEVEPGDASGCPPCYLDGHLHIHSIPAFRPVLGALLDSYRFRHVRVPAELRRRMPVPPARQLAGGARRELLSWWGVGLRGFLRQRGAAFPGYFVGSFASGGMTLPVLREGLAAIEAQAPAADALVEIMFHPYPPALADAAGGCAGHAAASPPGGSPCAASSPACPPYGETSPVYPPCAEASVVCPPAPADAAIAARQARLGAAYATPGRRAEGVLLLSAKYHQVMARHDPSWAGRETA